MADKAAGSVPLKTTVILVEVEVHTFAHRFADHILFSFDKATDLRLGDGVATTSSSHPQFQTQGSTFETRNHLKINHEAASSASGVTRTI